MVPTFRQSVSRVHAVAVRIQCLSFEKACSIGFRSGLYGGRNSRCAPAPRMTRGTPLEKIGQTIEHGSQILSKLRLWGAHLFALRNRTSEKLLSPAWSLLPLVRLFLLYRDKCGFADLLVLLSV